MQCQSFRAKVAINELQLMPLGPVCKFNIKENKKLLKTSFKNHTKKKMNINLDKIHRLIQPVSADKQRGTCSVPK